MLCIYWYVVFEFDEINLFILEYFVIVLKYKLSDFTQ